MNDSDENMLALLWTEGYFMGRSLVLSGGGRAVVLDPGIWDPVEGECKEAKVYINGVERTGRVAFGCSAEDGSAPDGRPDCPRVQAGADPERESRKCSDPEQVVLQLCTSAHAPLAVPDTGYVSRVEVELPLVLKDYLESANYRNSRDRCGDYMCGLGPLRLRSFMEGLYVERLSRKVKDANAVWLETDKDWNQTLYILMFRYVGGDRNGAMYARLARRVTYTMISRESEYPENVEALLLGTAGLLGDNLQDEYTVLLKENFDYLRRKYRVEPFAREQWEWRGLTYYNRPVLRIAELASFFMNARFVFENVAAARCAKDVYGLFSAEASDYWLNHSDLDKPGAALRKRLTREKMGVLGINVVAPLKFLYAARTGNERMKDEVLELMDSLPPESNSLVRRWTAYGVSPQSAVDSQALVQLSAEYCDRGRCPVCLIGRRLIKSRFGSLNRIK